MIRRWLLRMVALASMSVVLIVADRFDRARYDAEQIQLAFYTRLRHEVDMEAMTGDPARTATVPVAPKALAIWLRPRAVR